MTARGSSLLAVDTAVSPEITSVSELEAV
ncbi:MAG: hypothetical protein QOI36_6000, partial [Pseudonocardiales bacterium]|nr:hypothetical protein [Pseudonocardiales bacterium]